MIAAVIVTAMLIPQSLAYAMVAGLPPVVGLYASILPLLAYAVFGTSRTLSVGPVAVVSLMTAVAISEVAARGTAEYYEAAIALALLSGLLLVITGALRLGFLANFLSHPVISGFISASGILIAAGQLRHIVGTEGGGQNLLDIVTELFSNIGGVNWPTLSIGVGTIAFLTWSRWGLKRVLKHAGLSERSASVVARTGPVFAIAATTIAVFVLDLETAGVTTVGDIPSGLPPFALPAFEPSLWQALLPSAALISVIGFVESVSVGQTLAAKRRQSIDPDQELVGLGASNIAAAVSAGFPVTGGFSRSVVNFDAGAQTPAAGAFTAVGIAIASLFLTPLLAHLPIATLAATIIVAVLSLVDFPGIVRVWRYSKADTAAMAVTIGLTLFESVEIGVVAGVAFSIALYLWRTSRPHIAIVGRVPGTEHYRNVLRHKVDCCPGVLSIRIDGSLYFANARAVEDFVQTSVAAVPAIRHVVLQMNAVNFIDASALESLERIMHRLQDGGTKLHLSEVKGPVTDRLEGTAFLENLSGQVFLSHDNAVRALEGEGTTSEESE